MRLAAAVLSTLAVTAALPAQAQDAGDWIWRVGVHNVRPKSDNHSLVNVDAAAALPFEHDINLNGGG